MIRHRFYLANLILTEARYKQLNHAHLVFFSATGFRKKRLGWRLHWLQLGCVEYQSDYWSV
ncbi:hypothetical protein DIR46_00185 [Massilia oculi]|uniref:Uncharacterized protein n=1 Tax=Massilia oculi TaxID=945844 RepID=A0A2S2DCF7_9BURK|nr:hypothetical protein DIR46_00185 [Massilia oculi]